MAMRFGMESLFGKKQTRNALAGAPGDEGEDSVDDDALLSEIEGMSATYAEAEDSKVQEAERIARKMKSLGESIEQITRFSAESNANIASIVKFVEGTKADLKKRSQTLSENAELRAEILTLNSEQRRLQQELETARSEAAILRKNGAEIQLTLKETRESINNIRHSNKKLSDEFRSTMTENIELKEKLVDLSEALEKTTAKFDATETQRQSFKFELDSAMKQIAEYESALVQKDETLAAQHEANRMLTSDLSMLNRQYSELQDEKISLQSQLELERENLNHLKRTNEQEQRKHDNEAYALRAEIENIATQWRHSKSAAKEISSEIRTLRERARSAKTRIHELEHELEVAQEMREKHQDEILEQGAKFRELNLQYESALIELKQEQAQVAQLNKTVKQLSDETKKTQGLRIRYESALDQIKELKSLIQDYQLIKRQNVPDYEMDHREEVGGARNVISLVVDGEK